MEVALNSVVASSSSSSTRTTINTLPGAKQDKTNGGSNAMGLFNSGGGFKNENAITSSHGLALLASITLKKALNVNNNNSNYNHQQQPNGFMNTQTNNIFSFNSVGLATPPAAIINNAAIATATTSSLSSSSVTKITSSSNTTSSSSKNHNSNKKSGTPSTLAAAATAATSSSTTTNSATSSNSQSSAAAAAPSQPPTTTNNNGGGGGGGGGNKHNFHIPSDILDDLASRFIINVPDMELSNLIRICFQIELAHWFYLDFFCAMEEEKKLQSVGMKQFAMQLFQHIPFLRKHLSSIDKILEDWKNYKLSVPTYGAILISEDLNYCLLVQSYFAKCSWGFPKGKINENEDPVHCATREVYEETGYDITELIVPNDYIEAVLNYQYTRLYIVRNVPLQTQFSPRTRNEIKCCEWFPIDSLPINKNDAISKAKLGINANSFFMIMPFVKRLKKWVNDKRSGIETRRKFSGGGTQPVAAAGSSASPTSNSPLTTNMPVMAAGNNSNNNQKHSNANNSCKKNKQQQQHNNDDKTNALTTGGGAGCSAAKNATSTTILATNRSKRQRHKSMGDLDGIKLTNLSNNNNQSNYKSTTTTTTTTNGAASSTSSTGAAAAVARATAPSSGVSSSSTTANTAVGNVCNHNNNNNSNHKRCSSKVVNSVNINCANGANSSGSASTSKRQLFHSQSQNGTTQHGEKIVSSFDLIRKEKQQQLKAAAQAEKAAKAQKQQTQQMQQQQQSNGNANTNNNGGRVRAKSQSDKNGLQQLQQQQNNKYNNNANNSTIATSNAKQRIQKQQSLVVTNSNLNGIFMIGGVGIGIGAAGHKTPPPMSGSDLLALASAAAAATSSTLAPSPPPTLLPPTTKSGSNNSGPTTNGAGLKPRPSSVSLHFATPPAATTAATIQQLQRMASGTNLRILKRANSHQPPQQQQQPQQLKFTPSFNSWTNFSFTKNFIANVFC